MDGWIWCGCIDRVVVRFLVGFVGICREVEGDIKEIDFFQVGLDCYVWTLIFKNFGDFFPNSVGCLAITAEGC